MKKDRRRHLIVFVALFVLGQWCVNSWNVLWREVLVTDNGRIFTASSYIPFWRTEIWEWDSKLSSQRKIATFGGRYCNLHSNRDGSILVCDAWSKVIAKETSSGQDLWTSEFADSRRLHVLGDDEHVLAVPKSAYRVNEVTILNLQTGQVADRYLFGPATRTIQQIYLSPDGMTLERTSGKRMTYVWNGKTISKADSPKSITELGNARRLYSSSPPETRRILEPPKQAPLSDRRTIELIERSDRHSSTLAIVANDGKLIASRSIGSSFAMSLLLGTLFVMGGLLWVAMLLRDAARSQADMRKRGLIDLAWIAACLIWVTTPGMGSFVPEEATQQQVLRMSAIPMTVIFWFLFCLLSAVKKPLYRWTMVLCSCVVPAFVPTILLALLLRLANLASPIFAEPEHLTAPRGRKFRFGIHQLILATTAIAISISLGLLTIEMLPGGIAYAVVVVFALAVSLHELFAKAATVLSSTGLFAAAILDPQFSVLMWLVSHLLMLIFIVSFLSFYEYEWRQRKHFEIVSTEA